MGIRTQLTEFIEQSLSKKKILLMSHAVVGYNSIEENIESIQAFANAGVDLMELQFPFTDPVADGPFLRKANEVALKNGTTVDDGFALAKIATAQNPNTAFIIMTYYNLLYQRGVEKFVSDAKAAGIQGFIIPDLPIENAQEYIDACDKHDTSPIFMVTPDTSDERLDFIASEARGMIYCIAREGVSGSDSKFNEEFHQYLSNVKEKTDLPIGVGFGVKTKSDVDALSGKAEICIVCTNALKVLKEQGIEEAGKYLSSLR